MILRCQPFELKRVDEFERPMAPDWIIEFVDISAEYETIVLDYQEAGASDAWGGAALKRPGGAHDPAALFFRKVNPMGKISAIEHDGRVVTESGAIVAYLAETFPDAGLSPTEKERGAYYRWLFFAAGPLEQALTNHRAGFDPASEQEFFVGYGSHERTVKELERVVAAAPFLAGDRFTAMNVYVGSHVGWGLGLGTLPARTDFTDYLGRITVRQAFARATEKDNRLLGEAEASPTSA